jgi:hypothetical protein
LFGLLMVLIFLLIVLEMMNYSLVFFQSMILSLNVLSCIFLFKCNPNMFGQFFNFNISLTLKSFVFQQVCIFHYALLFILLQLLLCFLHQILLFNMHTIVYCFLQLMFMLVFLIIN